MWLQAIDNTIKITSHKVNHRLGILVPEKDVSTIAATDNVLRVGTKEVDTFNGATIAVNRRELKTAYS